MTAPISLTEEHSLRDGRAPPICCRVIPTEGIFLLQPLPEPSLASPSGAPPCSSNATSPRARAPCHQLCRGRATAAVLGAALKESLQPNHCSDFTRSWSSALRGWLGYCTRTSLLDCRAMPRQRWSLRGRLAPFLGKAKRSKGRGFTADATRRFGKSLAAGGRALRLSIPAGSEIRPQIHAHSQG